MPVTLDATVGGASANSYCTRAEAQAYVAELFPLSERAPFLGASETDQDLTLLASRRELDQLPFVGDRGGSIQALEWPRCGVYKKDRITLYLLTELPDELKRGQAVLAAFFARQATQSVGAFAPSDTAGLASITFGSELSMTFEPGAAGKPEGDRFLAQVIIPLLGGNLVRARQPRFQRG